jgi:hypothetical protein
MFKTEMHLDVAKALATLKNHQLTKTHQIGWVVFH